MATLTIPRNMQPERAGQPLRDISPFINSSGNVPEFVDPYTRRCIVRPYRDMYLLSTDIRTLEFGFLQVFPDSYRKEFKDPWESYVSFDAVRTRIDTLLLGLDLLSRSSLPCAGDVVLFEDDREGRDGVIESIEHHDPLCLTVAKQSLEPFREDLTLGCCNGGPVVGVPRSQLAFSGFTVLKWFTRTQNGQITGKTVYYKARVPLWFKYDT